MRRDPVQAPRRITLLTDFGTRDGYVAAMKGVIATIAPFVATIDDASHDIPPGDVHAAAFTLARYARWYPPETVHVVVVDPGVGTERRALAAAADSRLYVAPDNGVLTRVLKSAGDVRIVEISAPEYRMPDRSSTFHGRDVFAPAAAHLATGVQLDLLGPAVSDPVLLNIPEPTRNGDTIRGEVLHIDRFGNLITNIPGEWVTAAATVRIDDNDIGKVQRTYADVARGAALALIGSDGHLEVAVRDGSAAQRLNATRGTAAHVTVGE